MGFFNKICGVFRDVPRPLLSVATGLSLIITAVADYLLWPWFRSGYQKYSDIIVGEITISDTFKSCDFLIAYATIGIYFLSWVVLLLVLRPLWPVGAEGATPERENGDNLLLNITVGLFSYTVGIFLIRNGAGYAEFAVSVLALLLFLAGRAKRGEGEGREYGLKVTWLLLAGFFLFFTLNALVILTRFVYPAAVVAYGDVVEKIPLYAASIALVVMAACIRLPEPVFRRAACYVQLPVPLLLLLGFTRVYEQGGGVTGNIITPVAAVVALSLAIAGVWLNVRAMRRLKNENVRNPSDLIFLPAIVSICCFLSYKTPRYLDLDFFHMGEQTLSWQQLFELGQFPYSEFAVARGLGDALPGLLNVLFFEGNLSTITVAASLPALLVTGLNTFLLCRLLGMGWGSVMAFCGASSPMFKDHLVLPFLLVLLLPGLLANPLRWLTAWLFCSVFYCLYNHTGGIALTMGTTPVAVWMLYRAIAKGYLMDAWTRRRTRFLVTSGMIVALMLILAPLLKEWVVYVLDQGSANVIANGNTFWLRTVVPDWFRWQDKFTWEFFRIGGWIVGIFLLADLLARYYRCDGPEKKRELPTPFNVLCISGIFWAIAICPYSMGRIDYRGLSRPGGITLFFLGALLPLALLLGKGSRPLRTVAAFSIVIGVASATCYSSPLEISRVAVQPIPVPPQVVWVEGAKIGMPKLGNTFIDPAALDFIRSMKFVADAVLRDGETYLDQSNNLLLYYLLDKKVPAIYAGYYIVTSEGLQKKVIAALERERPPLVWIGPPKTYGSGTASLRSYRVYRWLLKSGYRYQEYNGLQFMVRDDRFQELFPVPPFSGADELAALSAAFDNGDIQFVPLAWGRNMSRLEARFVRGGHPPRQVNVYQSLLSMPAEGVELPGVATGWVMDGTVNGGDLDFITFRIAAPPPHLPLKVKVSWAEAGSPFSEERSLILNAEADTPLLVPLGSRPAWLLSPAISSMKIEVAGADVGGAAVEGVEFLGLVR